MADEHDYIVKHVGTAALYEALAEEASELAMAALKYARILRGENPTPVKADTAKNAVTEEYTDIHCVAGILDLAVDPECMAYKLNRWYERLKESENGEKT